MKYNKKLFIYIYIILNTAQSFAGELPVITLNEGKNTIALSIVNNWNNDLADVTVEVDSDKLPFWLSFQGTPQAVDVESETR